MKRSARLYNCSRCHVQVTICNHCDRGNIYCGDKCAKTARQKSHASANKKYQSSRQGRFANALRQQRYRARQKQKVTDQGSANHSRDALLENESKKVTDVVWQAIFHEKTSLHCHFCQCECSDFLRLGFIRRPIRSRRYKP